MVKEREGVKLVIDECVLGLQGVVSFGFYWGSGCDLDLGIEKLCKILDFELKSLNWILQIVLV